jgi:FtsH-binding integral membrane protein
MGVYFDNGHEAILGRKTSTVVTSETMRPLMRMVYMWMTLGLGVTGAIAAVIATQPLSTIVSLSQLYLPLILVELALVVGLSWGISRMSATFATGMFFVYAAVNGLTIGVIVFAYMFNGIDARGNAVIDMLPVAKAFFTTAGLFGTMSVIGYTTKIDLTRFSTFFMMALIGLLIAMVVNIFLNSGPLSFIISVVGVLIFTGLTAYDTQKIKNMAAEASMQENSEDMRKMSIMGALTLYLDFINLFLMLLRLFGSNRR